MHESFGRTGDLDHIRGIFNLCQMPRVIEGDRAECYHLVRIDSADGFESGV